MGLMRANGGRQRRQQRHARRGLACQSPSGSPGHWGCARPEGMMDDLSLARPAGHLIMGDGSGPDGLAKDGAKALSGAESVDTATTQLDKPSRTKNLRIEFKPVEYLASTLTHTPLGPTIFVFDNFETVVSPAELFRWLDIYVRPPNKILITTRTRDFVGELPLEVPGMTEQEAGRLVDAVARRLGITELLTSEYHRELYEESGGHPYVIKILLGEVAKERQARKPSRIIADQEIYCRRYLSAHTAYSPPQPSTCSYSCRAGALSYLL